MVFQGYLAYNAEPVALGKSECDVFCMRLVRALHLMKRNLW